MGAEQPQSKQLRCVGEWARSASQKGSLSHLGLCGLLPVGLGALGAGHTPTLCVILALQAAKAGFFVVGDAPKLADLRPLARDALAPRDPSPPAEELPAASEAAPAGDGAGASSQPRDSGEGAGQPPARHAFSVEAPPPPPPPRRPLSSSLRGQGARAGGRRVAFETTVALSTGETAQLRPGGVAESSGASETVYRAGGMDVWRYTAPWGFRLLERCTPGGRGLSLKVWARGGSGGEQGRWREGALRRLAGALNSVCLEGSAVGAGGEGPLTGGSLSSSPSLTSHPPPQANRAIVLVLTFLCYTAYHASRKPPSIVKSVLHGDAASASEIHDAITHRGQHLGRDAAAEDALGWRPFNNKTNGKSLLGDLDLAFLGAYAGAGGRAVPVGVPAVPAVPMIVEPAVPTLVGREAALGVGRRRRCGGAAGVPGARRSCCSRSRSWARRRGIG